MHDLIRKNLHNRIGLHSELVESYKNFQFDVNEKIKALEYILSLAKPRLVMGAIRYGHLPREGIDVVEYMQDKFDKYKETGNFEMLVDLVNYVAIEYVLKSHPKHHFEVVDRKE